MKKSKYVLGFMFSANLNQVLLIKKQKPAWQRGLWNGIGGACDPDREATTDDTMRREFQEESGIKTKPGDWQFFCTFGGEDWSVDCFYASSFLIELAKTQAPMSELPPEEVQIFDIDKLPDNCVPVLNWIVPMALGFAKKTERVKGYLVSCLGS